MAATLIHIKSRTLLPRPDPSQEDAGPEEDPREALVRRLLEHQKYKAAAELLHDRETLRGAQFGRPDASVARRGGRRLRAGARGRSVQPDVGVPGRARAREPAAAHGAAARPDLDRGPHPAAARRGCRRPRRAASRTCLTDGDGSRSFMIVTFLALLEMIRLKLIRVFQTGGFGADPRLQARAAGGCAAPDRRSATMTMSDQTAHTEQPDTDTNSRRRPPAPSSRRSSRR